jgi:hypothetical protein
MAEIYFPLFNKSRVESVLFLASPKFSVPENFSGLRQRLKIVHGKTLVFPSHLFEFQWQQELQDYLAETGHRFWIQVSLGAELFDYQNEIQNWEKIQGFCGVELLADRQLSATHLMQIKKLDCKFRFVCVPRADMRPVEFLRDFPEQWTSQTTVYFAPKQASAEERLSHEEIYLLHAKLKELRKKFEIRSANHLETYQDSIFERAEEERRFRQDPNSATLEGLISVDGGSSKLKLGGLSLAKKKPMLPAIVLPYGLLWILHDPLAAISSLLRLFRHPLRLFHQGKDLFIWLGYRAIEFLYLFRHLFIMAHVYLWRIKSLFVVVGIRSFYGLINTARNLLIFLHYSVLYRVYYGLVHWAWIRVILFAKNPSWYLQLAFPRTYWLVTYPPKKIYWFFEYQFRKRILRHGFK